MWTRGCSLALLVLAVTLAAVTAASDSIHSGSGNHSIHDHAAGSISEHDGGCGGGGHHGHSVKLASWRWCQYKNYVILCVTIILGTNPFLHCRYFLKNKKTRVV